MAMLCSNMVSLRRDVETIKNLLGVGPPSQQQQESMQQLQQQQQQQMQQQLSPQPQQQLQQQQLQQPRQQLQQQLTLLSTIMERQAETLEPNHGNNRSVHARRHKMKYLTSSHRSTRSPLVL